MLPPARAAPCWPAVHITPTPAPPTDCRYGALRKEVSAYNARIGAAMAELPGSQADGGQAALAAGLAGLSMGSDAHGARDQ